MSNEAEISKTDISKPGKINKISILFIFSFFGGAFSQTRRVLGKCRPPSMPNVLSRYASNNLEGFHFNKCLFGHYLMR